MESKFEVAAGSVRGRAHTLAGTNNQDAYFYLATPTALVGVVCDGCSSAPNSEIGAKLGAQMVAKALSELLEREHCCSTERLLELLRNKLLRQFKQFSQFLADPGTFKDYLLFTITFAVVTDSLVIVAALGDGVVAVNGSSQILTSVNNEPNYLAYDIEPTVGSSQAFKLLHLCHTTDLISLLIATDGAKDLLALEDQNLPGRDEQVGALSQFWEDDRYFSNSFQLSRRLTLINRELSRLDPKKEQLTRFNGLLSDDTTLLVIRRKH